MYNRIVKVLLILSILFTINLYSQKVSHIYKLAINEKDELVYVVDKTKSYPLKSNSSKERIIFDLLKDSMKDKKTALIVCTGEGSVVKGEYVLKKSRMCKDSTSDKILYRDFELSTEQALAEARNIDLVLSQGSDFSELSKKVSDTGRFVIEKKLNKTPIVSNEIKNEVAPK